MSEPLRLITEDRTSIVALTSDMLGSDDIVVFTAEPLLSVLVMVSPAVKDPEGILNVIVVELGFVKTIAVVPLEEPVMVLPITRLVEAPTVAVIVPMGYSERPDTRVWFT